MIVDVHCHFDHPDFDTDRDNVIERAKKVEVKAIISNGVNPQTNRKNLELAQKYDIVHAALGIYPDEVDKLSSKEIDDELAFIQKNKKKSIAIGEVGLDYASDITKTKQKKLFEDVIALSTKTKLPILIHSRKAEAEVIEMLTAASAKKVVLHCFSGNKKLMQTAYDNGYFFSVPTNIVRSKHFQFLVDKIPLSHILTETDAPYLSPYKDKRNESSFITETLKVIADIKKCEIEEVKKIIFMNYQNVFLK